MRIPLVDLKAEYATIKDEVLAGFHKVLDSMNLFLAENVQGLEKEFCTFLGTRHGIGVGTGTDALILALKACDVGPGDEVITVAHTFFATTEAIIHVGAKPVYVDIRPDTMLMDTMQIEQRLTKRTKAILPVHLYGQTVDMDEVLSIAKRHRLRVIEDAAQAHGARYNGKAAGSMGDIGCFSFYFSKNLGAYGEGGFCTTNDPELATRLQRLRHHGHRTKFEHELVGYNSRLDELQAVVLRAKLKRLAESNEARRRNAAVYWEMLREFAAPSGAIRAASEKEERRLPSQQSRAASESERFGTAEAGPARWPAREATTPSDATVGRGEGERQLIHLPVEMPGNYHVYHCYVIRVPRRDELFDTLAKNGIGAGIHYKIPNHLQDAVRYLGYKKGDLPVTEQVCDEVISLPMYPSLGREQIKTVCDVVKQHLAAR